MLSSVVGIQRFPDFSLSSCGGRKFQIPINELYKQIMRTGPADRGAEVKPVCRLAAGLNHCELGVQPRQRQDSFQDVLVCFLFSSLLDRFIIFF